MHKNFRDFMVMIVIVCITLWFMLKGGQTTKLPGIIMSTNIVFIILGLSCMSGFLFLDGLIVKELARIVNVKTNLTTAIRYAMIGQYFNLITPLSAGSQPAMYIAMTLKGSFNPSQSTSLLINKYIIYQITVTLYSILLLLTAIHVMMNKVYYAIWYALIGIALHLLTIAFMYLSIRNADAVIQVVTFISRIMHRIGFKNIDGSKVSDYAYNLAIHIHALTQNKARMFRVILLTVIQITLYFAIGYFIYRAFHLNEYSFIEIMAVQALLYMAVSFIPTPGNAGASEGAFYMLFAWFFPADIITAYVIVWRFIVFYLNLILSGCFTLYNQIIWQRF